jgi:hypothetical protein
MGGAGRRGGDVKKAGWLRYALHAAVLAGLILAGMKYVNGDALEVALRRFDWHWAPLIALLGLGSLLVKAVGLFSCCAR